MLGPRPRRDFRDLHGIFTDSAYGHAAETLLLQTRLRSSRFRLVEATAALPARTGVAPAVGSVDGGTAMVHLLAILTTPRGCGLRSAARQVQP